MKQHNLAARSKRSFLTRVPFAVWDLPPYPSIRIVRQITKLDFR